jgi:hypothetical protein
LIKKEVTENTSVFQSIFWNINPNFIDLELDDYHFETSSILNGNANAGLSLPFDLEGNGRSGSPDIGCFEVP